MTLREEIAAQLMDRDEGWGHAEWAKTIIATGKDAAHDGDCTNKCHTCIRCLTDVALQDADRLIETVRLANEQSPRPTGEEK